MEKCWQDFVSPAEPIWVFIAKHDQQPAKPGSNYSVFLERESSQNDFEVSYITIQTQQLKHCDQEHWLVDSFMDLRGCTKACP